MHKHKRLRDRYRFKGYEPSENLTGIFGDPKARVIHFKRREKNNLSTIWNSVQKLLRPKDTRIYLELEIRRVECRRCQKVTQERLSFLAENPSLQPINDFRQPIFSKNNLDNSGSIAQKFGLESSLSTGKLLCDGNDSSHTKSSLN